MLTSTTLRNEPEAMRSRRQPVNDPDRRRAHAGETATTRRSLIGRTRGRGAATPPAPGPEHRLACLQAQISVRVAQATVIAAGLAATVAAITAGVHRAIVALVACAVTEALLALSLATLLSDRRACALELIAHRHDTARRLAVVQRERRRLLARRHRRELARSLHALADEAPSRLACPSYRPLYTPRVLTAVAAELHATARLLSGDQVGSPASRSPNCCSAPTTPPSTGPTQSASAKSFTASTSRSNRPTPR